MYYLYLSFIRWLWSIQTWKDFVINNQTIPKSKNQTLEMLK